MKTDSRAEVVTVLLVVLGLLGLSQAVPNFRIANLFKKGPPTKELVAAQKAAADADARAKAAEERVAKIAAENEVKKNSQIDYSHEMVVGAIESNSHAPDSTEKAITDAMLQRADIGLTSAIGKLTPELRAEVIGIVAQLRSGDQEKIKAAEAMLAEKDQELEQATAERAKLEVEAKTAKTERDAAVKESVAVHEVVAAKTAQVVAYADKAAANEKEAGSLGALVTKLAWVVGFLLAVILFANCVLPSLAQEFPGIGWLVSLNKLTKSLTSAHQ